jgi:DNA-binding transcriptional MerR regulator
MPRKRYRDTRARDRLHRRPKTPAPTDGFLIHDVARLTGISVRTLRDYVRRGLLRHSQLRGTLTRYPRREVMRLFAALRLKAKTKATWARIRRQLDTSSEGDIDALLAEQELPPGVAGALGLVKVPNDSANAGRATAAPTERTGECWHRIVVLPGLELFVRATASPLVKEAAARLQEGLGGPQG